MGPFAYRAADKVSSTAAVGGQWANIYFKRTVDTTAEGIRKLTGTTLAVSISCHKQLLHAMQSSICRMFVQHEAIGGK